MKKYFAFILLVVVMISPASPLLAQNESVSFFEALSNFAKVEDYKLTQSFYGNAEFEEGEDHLTAEYRITVNSAVNGGDSDDSFNRINATIKFVNHNAASDSTPFKEMMVLANAEVVTQGQDSIYFKLNNFNVGLKDPLPFALTDVEELKAMVAAYQGTWFHSGMEELATDNLNGGTAIDVDQYTALEGQFKEEPKEAILGLSEALLNDTDAGLTEEEMGQALDGISLLLESSFFTSRPVVSGLNDGFQFFSLNKTAVVNVLKQFGQMIGEELTIEDEAMIRSFLSKISLSGIYRMDDVNGLIDNLLVRFKVKETGPVKNLELNYRYKVSDLNKENVITIPSGFEELNQIEGQVESIEESLLGLLS